MVEEFAEVVGRSEEFDLGVHAVVSAVIEPTTEALEELGESGLHQGTSLSVLLPAQRCGEAGCHLMLAAARAFAFRFKACLVGLAGHGDKERKISEGLECLRVRTMHH